MTDVLLCATCRFWELQTDRRKDTAEALAIAVAQALEVGPDGDPDHQGICRRRAPVPIVLSNTTAILEGGGGVPNQELATWPITYNTAWCGDALPRG